MKEIRNIDNQYQINDRQIVGYAVIFNSESNDLGGFTEVIERTALDGVIEKSDVLCLLNHNEDRGVLARSNKGVGSLKLSIDDKGLKYEFESPNTDLGNELLEGIKRGDISASSFAFTVGQDEWQKKPDGTYLRVIKQIDLLFDVSPVYKPAYDATTVDTRGLDTYKELVEYYKNLKAKLK